jgi:hypothetical protein
MSALACYESFTLLSSIVSGNSSNIPTVPVDHGNIHSFGTFVIFGIICVVVIAALFFSIIFG